MLVALQENRVSGGNMLRVGLEEPTGFEKIRGSIQKCSDTSLLQGLLLGGDITNYELVQ